MLVEAVRVEEEEEEVEEVARYRGQTV